MIYGVDCAYPPSRAQGLAIWNNGWRFMGCYIGGPRATAGHHGWANASVHVLADIGFLFLPIYVGRTVPYDAPSAFNYQQGLTDGDDANVLTGACGFDGTTPLCLDAEYGDWQKAAGFSEYLRGFGERVNGAGHKLCLYSDTETLNHFGSDLIDLKWGAAYSSRAFTQTPPTGRFDPASPPPWDCWQYASSGSIGGVSLDLNSATDDFPLAQYQPPQ